MFCFRLNTPIHSEENNLDSESNRGLQWCYSAALVPTCQTNHHRNEFRAHNLPTIEIRPENSIILARRYSKNHCYHDRVSDNGLVDVDYIYDHYSPVSTRKFANLSKSKSVDCHSKQTGCNRATKVNDLSYLAKSSPNVNNTSVDQRKPSKFGAILKKFDNKTTKTFFKSKNAQNKNKSQTLNDKEADKVVALSRPALDDNIRQSLVTDGKSNELVLRKTLHVPSINPEEHKVLLVNPTYELQRHHKTKYSPPPDDGARKIADLPQNDNADSKNNFNCNSIETNAVTVYNNNSNDLVIPDLKVKKSTSDSATMKKMRMKERLVVCFSVIAVLFTFLLIMDIQMDLGISRKHLVPSYGRVRHVVNPEGPDAAYNSFRNRLLQKTHR